MKYVDKYKISEHDYYAFRLASGQYRAQTIVGDYPLFYVKPYLGILCNLCAANHDVQFVNINYGNDQLQCGCCKASIPSALGAQE